MQQVVVIKTYSTSCTRDVYTRPWTTIRTGGGQRCKEHYGEGEIELDFEILLIIKGEGFFLVYFFEGVIMSSNKK